MSSFAHRGRPSVYFIALLMMPGTSTLSKHKPCVITLTSVGQALFTSLGQHSEEGALSTSARRSYHRRMLSRDLPGDLEASWYLVVFPLGEITAGGVAGWAQSRVGTFCLPAGSLRSSA